MKDMVKDQISIIVISYNNANLIYETLDSVFFQTYDNIQLVISDDASEKFNLNKIKNYVNKHKRRNIKEVLYNVNESNLGTVRHLEFIRHMCSGELITVIAADDAYACDDAISAIMETYFKFNREIKVISSILEMCDVRLRHTGKLFTSKSDIEMINSGDSRKLFEELSYRCILPSSGTAIAPCVYDQIGSLTNDYSLVEDWNSHVRMAKKGIKIHCIDKITVLHRDGGISHGNKRVNDDFYIDFIKDLMTIYEKEVVPYRDSLSNNALDKASAYHKNLKIHYKQLLTEKEMRVSKKKKIVFYFRKGVVAKGDFALYYCIAAKLSQNPDYLVFCVNNSCAELKAQYIDSGINFFVINERNKHLFADATFVTAVNQLFFLLEEIKGLNKAKILLLFLHPQIIDWLKFQMPKRFSLNGLGKLLCAKDAYGFMDIANYAVARKKISAPFEERYFPVVVNNYADCTSPIGLINDKEINIAWLGRLDGDKIYSLINFLDNLSGFDFGKKITIHLIGDGNAFLKIDINKYAPQIRFIFNSYLYNEERDQYLKENVDLVIAMGISAINGGILKIPTILPMVSGQSFRDNKFILLSDTVKYCLGVDSQNIQAINCKTYLAHKIVDMVYKENNKGIIGQQCYDCVLENFIVDNQIDNILNLINSTSLTVARCKREPVVAKQLLTFELYKKFRGKKRTYSSFLVFRGKLQRLKDLTLINKIKYIFF